MPEMRALAIALGWVVSFSFQAGCTKLNNPANTIPSSLSGASSSSGGGSSSSALTLSIEQSGSQSDPVYILPVSFDAVFSQAVTGFGWNDVVFGGSASGVNYSVLGRNSTYRIFINGATSGGTIVPTVVAAVATSASGASNEASTSSDNSVFYTNIDKSIMNFVELPYGMSGYNKLPSDLVNDVYYSNGVLYVATDAGLAISTNGGTAFSTRRTSNGLGSNAVNGVFVLSGTIYAATNGGLSISTDGGTNFTNKTTANGLGSNIVMGVVVSGGVIYAATSGGFSFSSDSGATFTNKTIANGLGTNNIYDVYVDGANVYLADWTGGLDVSADGGATFQTILFLRAPSAVPYRLAAG